MRFPRRSPFPVSMAVAEVVNDFRQSLAASETLGKGRACISVGPQVGSLG